MYRPGSFEATACQTFSHLALTPCAPFRSAGSSGGFELRYRLSTCPSSSSSSSFVFFWLTFIYELHPPLRTFTTQCSHAHAAGATPSACTCSNSTYTWCVWLSAQNIEVDVRLQTAVAAMELAEVDTVWLAQSMLRRRRWDKCIHLCSKLLSENPYDQV